MAQVPETPAKVRPAPTKPESAKNQGETMKPRITPSSTREPAVIWTWRMMEIGAARFTTVFRPAFFQPARP